MTGYGNSGRRHTASLVDLSWSSSSMSQPLARTALERLDALGKPGHGVEWPARVLSA
jgi:hypothetical protein